MRSHTVAGRRVVTTLQVGGAIGVAAFGSLYLALASSGPSEAFAYTSLALSAIAMVAAAAARQSSTSGSNPP
jgi:hypothetical protein